MNSTDVNIVDKSHFEPLSVLGAGSYGKVTLVRKKGGIDDGSLYAMKVHDRSDTVPEKLMIERRILEEVRNSSFIVTMHYAFQTANEFCLVLDFISGGDLFTHYCQRKPFSEEEVRFLVAELVLALEALHKHRIIHRDLKMENIMIDKNGHAVLADFDLCRHFRPHEQDLRATAVCGTFEYIAPEMLDDQGYDKAIDWWALGVITYELVTGCSPFTAEECDIDDESFFELTMTVENMYLDDEEEEKRCIQLFCSILTTAPVIPENLSPEIADFISKMLDKDPRTRLGGGTEDAEELKRHPFFRNINWSDLKNKKIAAPFKPTIANELDLSNFPEDITSEELSYSVSSDQPYCVIKFKGYSFVAPELLPSGSG